MPKKKLEAGEFFVSSTWINITVTLFPEDELNHLQSGKMSVLVVYIQDRLRIPFYCRH